MAFNSWSCYAGFLHSGNTGIYHHPWLIYSFFRPKLVITSCSSVIQNNRMSRFSFFGNRCFACTYVYFVHVWCQQRPEGGVVSCGAGLSGGRDMESALEFSKRVARALPNPGAISPAPILSS